MKRKINLVGNSTLTVSLPSQWAKERGLKKGDEVDVTESENRIVINTGITKKEPRKISFVLYNTNKVIIKNYLYAAYKLGFDEVFISFKDKETIDCINEKIKELVGFEIVSQKENSCVVKNIASPIRESYAELINKLFLVTISFSEDILKAFSDGQTDRLNLIALQENTQNKLALICMRLLQEKNNRVSLSPQLMHYCISEIESVGDDLKYICVFYKDKNISLDKECNEYFVRFVDLLRQVYSFYHNPNSKHYSEIVSRKEDFFEQGNQRLIISKKESRVIISRLYGAGLKVYDILRDIFQISLEVKDYS